MLHIPAPSLGKGSSTAVTRKDGFTGVEINTCWEEVNK